jgi:hypothetical protein
VQWSAETIERELLTRRQSPPDLPGTFAAAFSSTVGKPDIPALEALHRAGLAVAAAMDEAAAASGDLPYHGRHHVVDATFVMGLLCAEALARRMIGRLHAAAGLVAMTGHDIHHDGTLAGDGRLERRAQAAVEVIAAACGVDAASRAAIGAVILATDPTAAAANAARLEGRLPPGPLGPEQDVLNKLANEADIAGSLLPKLGPMLGAALAEEWRPLGNPALTMVATPAGRSRFLQSLPPFSEPAIALGLVPSRPSEASG